MRSRAEKLMKTLLRRDESARRAVKDGVERLRREADDLERLLRCTQPGSEILVLNSLRQVLSDVVYNVARWTATDAAIAALRLAEPDEPS